ncbi:MAG: PD-(D/E)XK nuclease family protein [Cyclobacteriaceae bacterium]|nr:PD-(D/E)XK nuclease family protein [Cyclobacteriaceae bacterium]
MQLNFFDTDTSVEKEIEKISWSPSKMGTLKQCPRKYYYQYYGSKQLKAKEDHNKERLKYLSNLSNKSLVAGEIIHSVIAVFFRKAKSSEVWKEDRLISFALSILRDTFKFTRDEREGIHNLMQYPPAILKEIYYKQSNEQEIFDEISERLKVSLSNFYTSLAFSYLIENGKKIDSIIEGKCNYQLPPNIKVDGVIDLAFGDQDKFWIADWKTGKVEEEDTSLQLLSYALWAIHQKGISKDSIVIQKAYLVDARLEELEYSEKHLDRARARIMQDSEILRELNDFGKEGNDQAFSKCGQIKICNLCPFQEVCDKSK